MNIFGMVAEGNMLSHQQESRLSLYRAMKQDSLMTPWYRIPIGRGLLDANFCIDLLPHSQRLTSTKAQIAVTFNSVTLMTAL